MYIFVSLLDGCLDSNNVALALFNLSGRITKSTACCPEMGEEARELFLTTAKMWWLFMCFSAAVASPKWVLHVWQLRTCTYGGTVCRRSGCGLGLFVRLFLWLYHRCQMSNPTLSSEARIGVFNLPSVPSQLIFLL